MMHLASSFAISLTRLLSRTSPRNIGTAQLRLVILSTFLCWGVSAAHAAGCPAPSFNVTNTYAVGQQPLSVALGDFNNDGFTDLVTANSASNNVSILLGDGQGNFGAAANFAAGAFPYSASVGDFNGDGNADVAAVNLNSSTVSVLLGNGTGGLGAPQSFTVGSSPRASVARDFNGDNKIDLAVVNFFGNSVSLLLGAGNGGFAAAVNYSTGATGGASAITSGDFNADGRPDVAVSNFNTPNVSVLLNNGSGGFAQAIVSNASFDGLAITNDDFNGDGKLDLAVAGTTGSVTTLLGNGTGSFVLLEVIRVTSRMQDVKTGDINGDGKVDLFTANYVAENVGVLLGNGQGGFAPPKYYGSGGSYPWSIAPGDFNRDGKLDLAVANNASHNVTIMSNDGQGGLSGISLISIGSTRTLAVADLNRDGRVDLITENAIFLANGSGGYTRTGNLLPGYVTQDVTTADFNGDGKLDIVVTGYNANIAVFLGDGAGGVSSPTSFAAGFEPRNVSAADFNRDGKADLVVTNSNSGSVTILKGDGTGGFAPAQSYPANSTPSDVALADMNADGQTDLVVTNAGINKVSILLGEGTGAFGAPNSFDVGQQPLSVAVADFNGDGKADVTTANSNAATASVLLGNGSGALSPATTLAVGFTPASVTTGDMNGDGKSDVVIANFNSFGVSVLTGDGTGAFAPAANFRTSGHPVFVAVADLNGDGKPDLAAVNSSSESNSIALLLNTCNAPFAPLPALSVSNASVTEGNAGSFVANFQITLSAPSDRTVTANYYTSDASATVGADYQFAAGRLTFAPGVTSQTISITINRDTLDEFDENIKLNFADVLNATPDEQHNLITILDDDAEPTLTISDAGQVTEGNSGAATLTFTIALSAPSGKPISVNYATADDGATAGSDYQAVSGTLNFTAGETSKTINVTINGDTLDEFDELFRVFLSSPVNATLLDPEGAGGILDDDLPPSASIANVSLREGHAGATQAVFNVVLSAPSGKPISLLYATADGSAQAGTDYQASNGMVAFNAGQTIRTISVAVNGDTTIEADESFVVTLSTPSHVTIAVAQGTGTILNDDASLAFSAASYDFSEGDARAVLTVTRTGDTSGTATIDYRTVDTDDFSISCADAVNNAGGAFARCDFSTTVGTLSFAPGEINRTINVPLINDAHVEGAETFQVQLSSAAGAGTMLGAQNVATVTIAASDTAGTPNPIITAAPSDYPFFVRQQYLDFLSREPEPNEPWTAVLNRCPNVHTPPSAVTDCDRLAVSAAFFGSPEFRLKGFYVFRFYKVAFNRLPEYREIVSDMSFVAGATAAEVFARRAQLATQFTLRQEFISAYNSKTNAEYVASLLDRYQLASLTTPDPAAPDGAAKINLSRADLTNALNAGTLTRAQVLRAVADSDQVGAAEYNSAFVAVQYYGYLRRTPDESGYQAWLRVINEDPNNVRIMVNGFLNSTEYRLRFGQP